MDFFINRTKHLLHSIVFLIRIFFQWIQVIIAKPSNIKYFLVWLRQINKEFKAGSATPWLTFEAIEWLSRNLTNEQVVFEWGSGGSTIFFAKKVKKVISIEHDHEWYKIIKKEASKYKNCDYFFIPQEKNTDSVDEIFLYRKNTRYNFVKYVKMIEKYTDSYFDVVVIDGRARRACLEYALPKIKKNGILVFDNADAPKYKRNLEKLTNWKRFNFYGPGPEAYKFWQTNIYIKP